MNGITRSDLERLTPAERRVFDELVHGRSNQAIAGALYLSESTVRSHLTRIYAKLGVGSRAELLAAVHRADAPSAVPGQQAPAHAAESGSPAIVAAIMVLAAVAVTVAFPLAAVVLGPVSLAVAYVLRSRPVGRFAWVRTAAIALGVVLTLAGVMVAVPVLLLGAVGGAGP